MGRERRLSMWILMQVYHSLELYNATLNVIGNRKVHTFIYTLPDLQIFEKHKVASCTK